MILRVEVSGTQRITYTQEYNAENRLAVVTNTVTGQVTRFVYDGDGNRVLRIGPEGTTVYIGDYYEKRGSVVTKYYDAAGQRMAMRVGGALYFLHGDHLGSATLTTDGGGNWVGEARYTPYGEMRQDYPRGVIPTDRLYTGQRWEASLGLYDYRARFYDPALGRFLQPDPLVPEPGNPQALNRYAYVYNNPLRYTDPDGHIAILATMGIGAAIGGIAMGVTYALTTDQFRWNECATAVAVGALAGALIGSGIGAIQGTAIIATSGVAVASATPIAATIAIGTGMGMAASGGGYMISNVLTGKSFDTTDFLVTSAVGAVEGGVSAIPGIGAGGRILASGAAGVAQSAFSDRAHGREVDWGRAAFSGGIGLVAGGTGEVFRSAARRAVALSESTLGPSLPAINMTEIAVRQLSSYQEITRQATQKAQRHAAFHAVRTVIRGFGYETGVNLGEWYGERYWR